MADSVLIIGGEPDFREKLGSSLTTEAGYEVTSAPNYVSARMIIENLVPDIIILDEIHQNGDDSFAVCKHLHDDYGIPVILLGEDSSDEMWEKVMETEADLYQIKPFSYPVLVARVKAILRRYKLSASGSKNGL
ncbi:MAG: response regulator [Bacteroidales bacterium]|nr:response regulator [Bacteroidales bacterium]